MTAPGAATEDGGVRVQLVVTYNDHQIGYYPTDHKTGWRIDAASRCIVIGKFPRTYVPLDQVQNFVVERIGEPTDA